MQMSNHYISHNKTIYDIFNMINPNCYQAFIIQFIIENKKEEALQCCDELAVAFEYYNWDSKSKQSNYTDCLICESNLEKWQKIAIIHIMANDIKSCKHVIEDEIDEEKKAAAKRIEEAKEMKYNHRNALQDLYSLFDFNSLL